MTDIAGLIERLRKRADVCRSVSSHALTMHIEDEAATALTELQAKVERYKTMVRDAYNEGFFQGMREHSTRHGGTPWSESKFRVGLTEGT